MKDSSFREGDAKTAIFGSNAMLHPAPVDVIPDGPTTPEIAYQMVKDETFAQTQPRLNLATFVTTYMDDYATKLMNEAININYIDETEYPRIAVMNGKCINIVANLWNSPEKDTWKIRREDYAINTESQFCRCCHAKPIHAVIGASNHKCGNGCQMF